MPAYDKTLGRLRLVVTADGARLPGDAHAAQIHCPTGWNDSCPVMKHTVSIEELRDLRYLIDRALAAAGDP